MDSTQIQHPSGSELEDPDFRAAWEDQELRDSLILLFYRLRKERGWSQAEVARRLETTQSAVSEFEKSISEPRLPTLQRWARAFGYKLDIQLKEGPLSLSGSWVERTLSYETVLGDIKVNNEIVDEWVCPSGVDATGQAISVPSGNVTVGNIHYRDPGDQAGYMQRLTSELVATGTK
ncbi:helix-turn-helix domain-containing protein [Plantactinospora sp. WMMC1484]|uniref:helix-turn-helix domain-containing protein n=1 Tax=Plantactinospora sp. WMMC1484 TaxID=3404122 RepID=UPI003BF47B14